MSRGVTITLHDLMRLREPASRIAHAPRIAAKAASAGGHLSSFRGRGMEFSEVRRYIAGDDVRTIDWRVTARTGQPHTKLFQEERERPVLIVVDQSKAMHFGTRRAFKSVAAAEAAALLAWSATERGDRVGGLVFSETIHHEVRPARGRGGALNFLRTLTQQNAPEGAAEPPGWVEAITRAQRIAKPGTLVYMISDFEKAEEHPEVQASLAQLSRHCEIALVLVVDPLEKDLPPPGLYTFSDGNKVTVVDSAVAKLREEHRARFEARHAQLERWQRQLGIKLIELSTAEDPVRTLHTSLQRPRKSNTAS